jgi:hypothetical protein
MKKDTSVYTARMLQMQQNKKGQMTTEAHYLVQFSNPHTIESVLEGDNSLS